LKELAERIHEDEKALEGLLQETPALNYLRSLPGMGPILAAVVVSEIDGIERFPSAQKLCGYAGLCPSTHSSGGKTFQGKLLRHCNKWLRWAFVEAAWVAIGCSAYFGDFYKRKRALGKKPGLAILATARLMARITWQLLTQRRAYTSVAESQYLRSQPAQRIACAGGLAKEVHKPLKDPSDFSRRRLSPAAPE
jgi:transposase